MKLKEKPNLGTHVNAPMGVAVITDLNPDDNPDRVMVCPLIREPGPVELNWKVLEPLTLAQEQCIKMLGLEYKFTTGSHVYKMRENIDNYQIRFTGMEWEIELDSSYIGLHAQGKDLPDVVKRIKRDILENNTRDLMNLLQFLGLGHIDRYNWDVTSRDGAIGRVCSAIFLDHKFNALDFDNPHDKVLLDSMEEGRIVLPELNFTFDVELQDSTTGTRFTPSDDELRTFFGVSFDTYKRL